MPVPRDLTPSSLFSHQDDGNNDIHWSRRCGEATVCYVIITLCVHAKSLWSFLALCDPVDRSPPGFSVQGILQARILEWAAMPSSRGSS